MKLRIPSKFVLKFLIVTCLFFGLSAIGYSQDTSVEKELDSIALKMFTDTNNRDFEAIMDMTHPAIFDIAPREAMITMLSTMFEGTEEMSVDLPKIIPDYKISEVFKDEENNSDYAFVSYDLNMTMAFHKEEFDDATKERMKKMMKLQDMHVEFISNNSMDVLMSNRMTIFIKDEATKNKWAMINYDTSSPIFFQILSASILEKAKDYYEVLKIESKKTN